MQLVRKMQTRGRRGAAQDASTHSDKTIADGRAKRLRFGSTSE
jgi:hypothetical protein